METNLEQILERLGWEDRTLYVASTGKVITDTNGIREHPRDYAVLATSETEWYEFASVRGPSKKIDVATFHDGCQLHQDALKVGDEIELKYWIHNNYRQFVGFGSSQGPTNE